MTFKEQMKEDAEKIFLNEDGGFVESIGYTPYSKPSLEIKAVVTRAILDATQQGSNMVVGREAEIAILNDEEEGITSVDKGRDRISMSLRRGGTAVSWSVVEVLSKDEAMFRLKVRR